LIINATLIREILSALFLVEALLLAYPDIDSGGVLLSHAEYIISHFISPLTLNLIV